MSDSRSWFSSSQIKAEHNSLPIKQVYCWIYTADKRIVIVSKDKTNWQFPGGKPQVGESIAATAIREVQEETGLAITEPLTFFGYYVVEENNEKYLQVRLIHLLNESATHYKLGNNKPAEDEYIIAAEFVDLDTAQQKIPWLGATQELQEFINRIA